MNTSRPKMTIARRVSPNAKIPFNTDYCSRTKCRHDTVNAGKTRVWSGLAAGQDVEKYRAFGDDLRTRSHSLDDLVIARILQSDLDRSFREVMAIRCEPDCHGAVALAADSLRRDRHGVERCAGDDDERSEHTGQKFVLRVFDLGAYQPPMQLGIDRRADGGNLSVEYTAGKRHDGDLHVLSLTDQGHIAFSHAGIHPDAGDVGDGIGSRRVDRLHEVAGRCGARGDASRDRTRHDQVWIDGAGLDDVVDLRLRLAENRHG